MYDVDLGFADEDGAHIRAEVILRFIAQAGLEQASTITDDKGTARFEVPDDSELVGVLAESESHWALHSDEVEDCDEFSMNRLPAVNEPAWWLTCMGLPATDLARGRGIRIGVVDADFRSGAGLDHVEFLDGIQPEGHGNFHGWGHGEMVCRILGDRSSNAAQFLSAAPGSEIIFAGAGGEINYVDPALAVSAIYQLLVEHDVHIISLSWGDQLETAGIRDVVEFAAERGVTVFAAVGNDPGAHQPYFPARSDVCIGIGAVGLEGWGPPGTLAAHYAKQGLKNGGKTSDLGPIYAWSECTVGHGLDAVAPGVAILVQRDGNICFDLTGTSFATPLAAGVLAVALSTDQHYLNLPPTGARTDYARQAFVSICRSVGLDGKRQGIGIPSLGRDS